MDVGGGLEELTASAIRTWLLSKKPRLEVKAVLILFGRLWHTWAKCDRTVWARCMGYYQNQHPANTITLEGRFSTEPYAWNGLNLSVPDGEQQNTFEGVLAEIAAAEVEPPGALMDAWLRSERLN